MRIASKPRPVRSVQLPVTVVVTVLNEAITIRPLLKALSQQTYTPAAVIIVDGGSCDQTLAVAKAELTKLAPPWSYQLLTQTGNRSRGRNSGITAASTDWIAITDAGCVPEPSWLAELVARAQALDLGQPAVVAGYYRAKAHTPLERAIVPYALVMPDQVDPEHFLPATRSMLLNKTAWELVGKFDEGLSDNEDYAFARRLAAQPSCQMIFAEKAVVVWQPRSTISSFFWMIFRFARGDSAAKLFRPKVGLVFARYLGWLGITWGLVQAEQLVLATGLTAVGLGLYAAWAVLKNYRYVQSGWYWLPVLQLVADLGVLSGTLAGARWWLRPSAQS